MNKRLKIRWWHIALALCLAVVFLSPLASQAPDGLERVAEDKGFVDHARPAPFQLVADYVFPGIENDVFSTIAAGLLGTAFLFGLVYGLAWLINSRKRTAGAVKSNET